MNVLSAELQKYDVWYHCINKNLVSYLTELELLHLKNLLPLILLLLLCLANFSAFSKAPLPDTPVAKHITYIPFTMLTGGIIIVRTTFDSFPDSLNFVLDTGSGGISLDSATCEYLKVKKERSNIMIKGIAGMRAVEFAYNHTLNLPGLVVDNLDFHISDYDVLTSVYGMKIDGIMGYSFLHRYVVMIDYEKSRLEIFSKGFYKYPHGGYVLHPKFNTLPIQQIGVKEKRDILSNFYFDTGAGLCFLMSDQFSDDSVVFKGDKKMYPTLAQGLGGKAEMNVTTVKEVKIGPYKFRNVPTYIFADPYNATSYPQVSGLIGNDLMRRFTVILNYTEREIFIKPNSFYRDSFDYSYTGLGLYMVDNKIVALDIMKDSPAEKAGLQEGDVIVSINKDFSGNIQAYKAMLQSAKTTQVLFVSRENVGLLKITLKVKSIYR